MTIQTQNIAIHRVGNKTNEEHLLISKTLLQTDEETKQLLEDFFLSQFKSQEYFHFYHEADLNMNQVFACAVEVFENPGVLLKESVTIARHLYEKTAHPQTHGGELFVVLFNDIVFDDNTTSAIGLFKSEKKESFIKIDETDESVDLSIVHGINMRKPDKGCLIFNTDKEKGYVVSVVDNTGRGAEAESWIDNFLHLQQRKDEYFNTQQALQMCKSFVTQELPKHYEVSRADQADLLNKSVKFFKEKDGFDVDEFTGEVIGQPEIIDTFEKYRENFQRENDVEIAPRFAISESAVKKQARIFKSIIKLDKNFHIYIHGNREMIEQGTDEKGRKYYRIFYENER